MLFIVGGIWRAGLQRIQNLQYLRDQGGDKCSDQQRDRFPGCINAVVIVTGLTKADFNILPGMMSAAPGQRLAQGGHQHFQKSHRIYSGLRSGSPLVMWHFLGWETLIRGGGLSGKCNAIPPYQ